MPWSPPVPFAPGVNTVKTAVLNGSGWSLSNLIRFRDGLPEKNGGWARMSTTPMIGVMRGCKAWADLEGNPYFACGSEQRLEVLSIAGVYDITPLRQTDDVAVDFSTIATSKVVTVVDASQPADLEIGDWVNINVPVSVGGLAIQGFVQVTAVPTSTSFSFDWTSAATGTVNNGGAVPVYTFTNTSTTTRVTLNDHGLTTSNEWINQIALTSEGVTIGAYTAFGIINVIDANNFQITTTAATGSGSASENGGDADIQFLVPTGDATAVQLVGFGVGLFGTGLYQAQATGNTYSTIRQWFLDAWGQNLVGNYPGSPIFQWVPPVNINGGNAALAINGTNYMSAVSPPTMVNVSFVSMPQQIMIALGCDPPSSAQDPNLVRWSDVGDNTDWVASATNQAGSFRIPSGSRIVGGLQGPSFCAIWTDVDMWLFNYIGFPLVFGFNKVEGGAGLMAGRCCAVANSIIYWVAQGAFYKFDGSGVSVVDCPVWDTVWKNLNTIQIDKCHLGVNTMFQEITLFFPSLLGTGEIDSYVRYNWREGVWDYGALGTLFTRTCWQDTNPFGPAIGVDLNALIQQHEVALDADGQAMGEFLQSGYFAIDNGWLFTTIMRAVADFKYMGTNPSLQFSIVSVDYPTDTPVTSGPFTATPAGPGFETVNARGRMLAIAMGNSSVGSWWRLGNFRHEYAPNGSN